MARRGAQRTPGRYRRAASIEEPRRHLDVSHRRNPGEHRSKPLTDRANGNEVRSWSGYERITVRRATGLSDDDRRTDGVGWCVMV